MWKIYYCEVLFVVLHQKLCEPSNIIIYLFKHLTINVVDFIYLNYKQDNVINSIYSEMLSSNKKGEPQFLCTTLNVGDKHLDCLCKPLSNIESTE